MRPRIVYVHGNGNKVRRELLKSQWDRALFGRDMGEGSAMAYWAPVRYDSPLPDFRADPLEGEPEWIEETPGLTAVESAEEFIEECLAEARQETPGPDGVPREGVAGPETAAALSGWLRDMTYLADTLAPAEEEDRLPEGGTDALPEVLPLPRPARKAVLRLLIKRTFKDVYGYFFGGVGAAMRTVVRETVADAGPGPLVVVGHSLGSIIAYEVLREQRRDVELFLTVGSPLGITEIKDCLEQRPAVPACVSAWCNASDLRDLVAMDHTLRGEYAPDHKVTDLLVSNDSGNHHGISEYLGHARVQESVRRVFGPTAWGSRIA
ncbi:hypothetical protein [Streptomyces sp. MUM 178J]|uniref:hypothetical protein n=1 Tax=Streptomyces sp. MUM 178J TaxID=2791991 RepID=UPI001F03C7A0|nr:hypothetical protein [Streptomyces sp. MUM 178J]WRQ78137.1 hypothetical protein I3F59_001355 [Streptomyces sp. MUM 178J]